MPIFLEPPRHDPRGPDGKGWNRLSIAWSPSGAQCALKPHSLPSLAVESYMTTRARWGGFGPCTDGGACRTCPTLTAGYRLDHADPSALVRLRYGPDGTWQVRIMKHPDDDFEAGTPTLLTFLARLTDYAPGRFWHIRGEDRLWLHRRPESTHVHAEALPQLDPATGKWTSLEIKESATSTENTENSGDGGMGIVVEHDHTTIAARAELTGWPRDWDAGVVAARIREGPRPRTGPPSEHTRFWYRTTVAVLEQLDPSLAAAVKAEVSAALGEDLWPTPESAGPVRHRDVYQEPDSGSDACCAAVPDGRASEQGPTN